HLLVMAAILRPAPVTRDHERSRPGDEMDRIRVDPRQLGDDDDLFLGPVAVDLRTEAAAEPAREREDLPEVGEELLDLLGGVLEVASLFHGAKVPRTGKRKSWLAGLASSCAFAGPSSCSGSRASSRAATP